MGKLDPNLMLLVLAGAGGLFYYFKMGGREALEGMMSGGGGGAAAAVDPKADVAPAPEAAAADSAAPEPTANDVNEEWEDEKGTVIYIIKVDGWMWVNHRRMYPPDHEMWARYYRMKKYRWRHRGCRGRYRNSRWCKDKHRWCVGAWKHTPWCSGFKRGDGGGRGDRYDEPPWDREKCPHYIQMYGKKYRSTKDPMPDVMPSIFPPPYVKEGICVYKLDNNNGRGDDGRDGWDGDRGGSGGGRNGESLWDKITKGTSFYTYNRIGNV